MLSWLTSLPAKRGAIVLTRHNDVLWRTATPEKCSMSMPFGQSTKSKSLHTSRTTSTWTRCNENYHASHILDRNEQAHYSLVTRTQCFANVIRRTCLLLGRQGLRAWATPFPQLWRERRPLWWVLDTFHHRERLRRRRGISRKSPLTWFYVARKWNESSR